MPWKQDTQMANEKLKGTLSISDFSYIFFVFLVTNYWCMLHYKSKKEGIPLHEGISVSLNPDSAFIIFS